MKFKQSLFAVVLCLSLLTPMAAAVTAAPPVQRGSGISIPVVGTVVGGNH